MRTAHKLLTLMGQGINYSLRDIFNTALAAGSVNGTLSEPGPGTRNVTDFTGANVLITGSKLRIIGDGTWNHEGIWLTPALTRAAGLVIRSDFGSFSGAGSAMMVLTTAANANFSGYSNVGIKMLSNGVHQARRTTDGTSVNIVITAASSGAWYTVLRNTGRYICYDPQTGADIQLVWWDAWDNTATLYMGATNLDNNFQINYDNFSSPKAYYFNIGSMALASDSFNRADGVLGSTDGAGHAEANGGSGKAWVDQLGTWGIATNKAAASALSGGKAMALVDIGTRDLILACSVTRSAGVVGIVLRWTDANNYLIAYHDGTNAKLDEVVAGTPTTRITAAATYNAGSEIRVRANGAQYILYYNDLYVGNYGSGSALLTGTKCGMYTTDTGATFDNFVLFGQYGYNALRAI